MGSAFKQGIFGPIVHESLESWLGHVREREHGEGSNRFEMQYMAPELREDVPAMQETTVPVEGFTPLTV